MLAHRRGLAVLLTAVAVWSALGVVHPAPPPTTRIWTAADDLTGGRVLVASDLRAVAFPRDLVPAGSVRDRDQLLGHLLATPLTRGDPVTHDDVLGPTRLEGYPGTAALGLRVGDDAVAALLRAGEQVELVATDPQGAHPAELLVHDAVVLAVPRPTGDADTVSGTGRLVVFAVPGADAEHVADIASARYLTVIWNR